MISLTFVVATAAIGFAIARWGRLPSVPLLILSGIGLAAARVFPDPAFLQEILLLGLTFLMFSAGTELNPQRFGKQRWSAITIGTVQFFAIGGSGLGLAFLLGLDHWSAVYLGLGLAVSSTLVVVRTLQQQQLSFEPFGRLVVGVLLVQDCLVILFISGLSQAGEGVNATLIVLLKTLGIFGLAAVFLIWISPFLILRFAMDQETLLLMVLSILFLFLAFSFWLGLPLVVGAFVAGVSLSGFPINGLIRGQLTSLTHFFSAIFFVSLGATLSLPEPSELALSLLLILMVLLCTPPLVTVLAERAGFSARASIESGLLLSQTSEFSIILALLGIQQMHIGENVLGIIALVTVVTMILTPFVATEKMAWKLMRIHPSRWQVRPVAPPEGHVLLLGCGESGLLLLDRLKEFSGKLLVVDDDPAVVERLNQSGVKAIRGDGADFQVLRAAGARRARVVISTMRRLKDHLGVLKVVRTGKVICRVFEESDAHRIRQRNGIPVLYSHAAAAEFLRWFDEEFAGRSAAEES